MKSNKEWKVLYVASRSEKKVCDRLLDLGIEAYVPMKTEVRQWSDRKKKVKLPLISGYVFINVGNEDRDKVFFVDRVVGYVRNTKKDAVVKQKEIDVLKTIEDKGFYVEVVQANIQPEDKVLIKQGPFKGLEGKIKMIENNYVYVTDIQSIGFALKIKIPIELVTKSMS